MSIKIYEFVIEGSLPALNEYVLACRSCCFSGASMKKKAEKKIRSCLLPLLGIQIKHPVFVTIEWHCPNRKKDKDNVAFAKKFILDALVNAGILQNDGWNDIVGFADVFCVSKENPHIKVILKEEE